MSFFQDWGPLNVAMVYKACIFIHSLLIVSGSMFHETRLQVFHDRCTKERETEQTIVHTLHPKPTPISWCPRMLGELWSTTNTATPLLGLIYFMPDNRSLYAVPVPNANAPFQDEDLASHRLILYTSDDPQRKANAALLISLFSVRLGFLSLFLSYLTLSLANCTTTRTVGSLSAYRRT